MVLEFTHDLRCSVPSIARATAASPQLVRAAAASGEELEPAHDLSLITARARMDVCSAAHTARAVSPYGASSRSTAAGTDSPFWKTPLRICQKRPPLKWRSAFVWEDRRTRNSTPSERRRKIQRSYTAGFNCTCVFILRGASRAAGAAPRKRQPRRKCSDETEKLVSEGRSRKVRPGGPGWDDERQSH